MWSYFDAKNWNLYYSHNTYFLHELFEGPPINCCPVATATHAFLEQLLRITLVNSNTVTCNFIMRIHPKKCIINRVHGEWKSYNVLMQAKIRQSTTYLGYVIHNQVLSGPTCTSSIHCFLLCFISHVLPTRELEGSKAKVWGKRNRYNQHLQELMSQEWLTYERHFCAFISVLDKELILYSPCRRTDLPSLPASAHCRLESNPIPVQAAFLVGWPMQWLECRRLHSHDIHLSFKCCKYTWPCIIFLLSLMLCDNCLLNAE